MNRITTCMCLICGAVFLSCSPQQNSRAIQQDPDIEKSIRKHLKEMSLEEKIGQMTQLNITEIIGKNYQLDSAKADKVLRQYKVGSILNTPYGVAGTPERYYQVIRQIQELSMETTGIPCIYGLDQIHGATYTKGATFFPQEVNIAATFNREHAFNMGKTIGYETRASNVAWTFSPVMDLGRNPIWPRIWESFGEDVYLNAEMAVAELKGIQGEDPNHVGMNNVAACIKHYMAYGVPVSGQDRTPSSVTPSDMREKYFEPFKECIQAGALSLMVNSANNNGMPFHCNYEYLTEWLKEDLGWDGMIVTDWNDIYNLHSRDHVASSRKEAVKLAINAGIDMAMVPMDTDFCDYLKELVEEGEVKMERIDDAVARVLRLKYRLGLFEQPYWDVESYPEFNSPDTEQLAYQAAVESEVLLKNKDKALPLEQDDRILVTGPNANSMRTLNGGWSYSWQGDVAGEERFSGEYHTIYEALQQKFSHVDFVPGVSYDKHGSYDAELCDIPAAVAAARKVDVIIACVGENTYCETPGNDTDLFLSENQIKLVKALHKTGKKLILILNEGRPRIVKEIEPMADAVIDIMLPGNYGGDALAALLCGEENFSGKLPFTYPKYINKWATYDYKPCEFIANEMEGIYNYDAKMDVQWKFGYGLSYTDFEYSNLKVSQKEFGHDDTIAISVDVRNTGKTKGKESVLLYTSDMYASSTPDIRRLRNFAKIDLEPGEMKTVTFQLEATDLAFVNYHGKWTLEEGDFIITAGNLNESIHCTETKVWEEPNID